MGRLFTVNFKFLETEQSALISFPGMEDDLCIVRFTDDNLRNLFPGGKIQISLSNGIQPSEQLSQPMENLVRLAISAIKKHLHIRQP